MRPLARTAVLLGGLAAAVLASPGSASATELRAGPVTVYASTSDGTDVGAYTLYAGAHHWEDPKNDTTRTCGGVLWGGCVETSGDDTKVFVQGDLVLYGAYTSVEEKDDDVTVCSATVIGICTP